MRIFLLWHCNNSQGRQLELHRVASSLVKTFSPLFLKSLPTVNLRQNSTASMVVLQLPVAGWKTRFIQDDNDTWAFAADYPINARNVLGANGIHCQEDDVLPTLGRALQGNAVPFLREMAPPLALVWSSKHKAETFVQNDGLGYSQLFEYQDGQLWALTNKIAALRALGVPLGLEREDWAVRSAIGWFPLNLTGFKNVRFLSPGTQLCLDPTGVHRKEYDVLSEWLNPPSLSQEDCLELARCSLLQQIQAALPQWEKPSVGLTGGWDSRAVVSSLRVLGVDVSLRVKGQPEKFDVVIASELAKIAGLALKVKASAELPPENSDDCRRSIALALLWQAGHMVTEKHKTFLTNQGHLDGGNVNIMGQHGEIGRGYFASKIQATGLDAEQFEEALINTLSKKTQRLTKKVLRDRVGEIMRDAYRQARRFDLEGLEALDFFYLYERTRRWASGSLNSQTGLIFAPFLNPDYIRAVYAYRRNEREANPFHKYIISRNTPDWVNVPYEEDLIKKAQTDERNGETCASEPQSGVLSWKSSSGRDYYNLPQYWKVVGKSIIDAALAHGGFWEEVFDSALAESQWHTAPDELTMLYLLPQALQS